MARSMTKLGIPIPIPIFAPVEKPLDMLGGYVVFAGGEVDVVDVMFVVDVVFVVDAVFVASVEDVVAEPDLKAVISVLCHMTTMPSPKIAEVPPEAPPRTVGSGGFGAVDMNTLFPMFVGCL
jgi:hypothetical protein